MNAERRERLPVSVSSAVLIEDGEGRLLLLQQAEERKGYKWSPPSGCMESHEDPRITGIRETREEIGVDVELVSLLGVYTIDRGDNKSSLGFVFKGKIVSGEITPRVGEIQSWRFFTPTELETLIQDNLIHKPEYNLAGIEAWLSKIEYPIEVVKPLIH